MEENTNRVEAIRLLGIAEKLLQGKDLSGSRDFAILAQETEPLIDGSDQILAVADVLLASEKRINNHHDWYAILQVERREDDLEVIKKQYRRLALLLHADKNKFAFADHAYKLVADAWAVLSDSVKKTLYDNELSLFSKIDLVALKNQRSHLQQFRQEQEQEQHEHHHQKLPVRRSFGAANSSGKKGSDETTLSTFWTACPYCYNLYEYARVYEGYCLRCQNCQRAIHGVQIQSLPPMVPGREAYYCCWALFPLGFEIAKSEKNTGFPNWMPPMFPTAGTAVPNGGGSERRDGFVDVSEANVTRRPQSGAKKRGIAVACRI
ncbi:hypothetical protein F0562_027785 [Nyssa sinensis]|uniref:J domain-containing protein n=1 Tax=Nyssa sinensis TaxID=561372 RepID=A0A5J5B8V6_9ASTE|nr:hypothetical protein F0562_027785 [Nyssa sinensis]